MFDDDAITRAIPKMLVFPYKAVVFRKALETADLRVESFVLYVVQVQSTKYIIYTCTVMNIMRLTGGIYELKSSCGFSAKTE